MRLGYKQESGQTYNIVQCKCDTCGKVVEVSEDEINMAENRKDDAFDLPCGHTERITKK